MGKNRTTEDMIRILQEEVEIPQIVQRKADAAFRQIRIEAAVGRKTEQKEAGQTAGQSKQKTVARTDQKSGGIRTCEEIKRKIRHREEQAEERRNIRITSGRSVQQQPA